ncbi:MAG: T9SS type A sorting domain-containing protein, partial [Dysgonamonadaceae bacterium]|nr:T9SS type A sorting domain-containing protein [Dysgonamonadaceae bacterium]
EMLSGGSQRVWAYRNTLYINAKQEDVVSIYNMTGVLREKIEIGEGVSKITLERGLYVITLKDGSVHKIVIR